MKSNTLSLIKFFPAFLLLILPLYFSACGSRQQAPVPSKDAKLYEIKGKVISANKAKLKVSIDHEDIPGYMDKMTMEFSLYDPWVYEDLTPGAIIQATLVVDGGKSWLQNPIVTTGPADQGKVGNSDDGIGPNAGTEVPDFALVNQDGRKIHFKQYRGQSLLVTFIYTRCPLPDYCPLMSQNFAQIQKELAKNPSLKDKTHLLSISIDPDYDKPQVLREYGARYLGSSKGEAFKQWEFASGSAAQVKEAATFFGMTYWPEKGQVVHSLRTALITPDGKVFKVYHDQDWKPVDIIKEMEKLEMAG
ncbi:MAG: SCO family protein [Blastocatellia bacterium]|nr:SCO family protein [Blastocatellia bacterium]